MLKLLLFILLFFSPKTLGQEIINPPSFRSLALSKLSRGYDWTRIEANETHIVGTSKKDNSGCSYREVRFTDSGAIDDNSTSKLCSVENYFVVVIVIVCIVIILMVIIIFTLNKAFQKRI